MGITAAIAAVFDFGAKIFNWATGRSALKNAPNIQAAAQAKQLQAQEDQITKDVADGNLDAIRKDDAAK